MILAGRSSGLFCLVGKHAREERGFKDSGPRPIDDPKLSSSVLYWLDTTRFYGTNGMCFPLNIDNPLFLGCEYSAFIFLGLNMTTGVRRTGIALNHTKFNV
ncbi:unnamed protein product [Timema podura]|uniref:Uncharacterized protein n=1 Tax=Timema podura TaxID=61482 RepID=A0ABN7P742_TIMPD|nr:unnamed protein product [Timema podura]